MSTDIFTKIAGQLTAVHDNIQQSDSKTDPYIVTAIEDLAEAVRLLAKEAQDADRSIRRMSQP